MPSPYEHEFTVDRFSARSSAPIQRGPEEGRKGSYIAAQYARGERAARSAIPASHPTNEEVAKAVQIKVAAAVEMTRKYRHVAWYSAFVAVYMVVLYLQANAYRSGEVVQTMRNAFLPDDGSTTLTFKSEDEVLTYIGEKVLLPIWNDPVCGDGQCEYPWEYAAWGRFGCKSDCGVNPNTTAIVLNVRADFTGHPSIPPRALMANVAWNMCLEDEARRKRGEPDLCWYEEDQTFSQPLVNAIISMRVIDGSWYVVIKGDYAGRVSGAVYDARNSTGPVKLPTTPSWAACRLNKASTSAGSSALAVRRLLQAYSQANEVGGEEGERILEAALQEVEALPELAHLNLKDLDDGPDLAQDPVPESGQHLQQPADQGGSDAAGRST